jgi:hypothetical protein
MSDLTHNKLLFSKPHTGEQVESWKDIVRNINRAVYLSRTDGKPFNDNAVSENGYNIEEARKVSGLVFDHKLRMGAKIVLVCPRKIDIPMSREEKEQYTFKSNFYAVLQQSDAPNMLVEVNAPSLRSKDVLASTTESELGVESTQFETDTPSGMITKQRKVGGSMVFTVPKEFADTEKRYSVSRTISGQIVYTPIDLR